MTIDTRIDELEQQVLTLQRRLVEAEAKTIRAEQQLERVTIEVGVRDAIAKSPTPVAPAALADVIRRAVQVGGWHQDAQRGLVRRDGGLPDIDLMDRDVTPKVWLENLQNEAPHLFQAAGGSDAGAIKNPFAKDTWNMTAQGKLFQSNPDLARQLAVQAGVRLEG
jgi:hypothetical protein